MKQKHALDIHVSREEFLAMTPDEREKFIEKTLDAMTPEQQIQMA